MPPTQIEKTKAPMLDSQSSSVAQLKLSREAEERVGAYLNPSNFLLSKGWLPCGDHRLPETTWLDPTRPSVAKEEKRLATVITNEDGQKVEVYQTNVTLPAYPLLSRDAVDVQLERDRIASHIAEKQTKRK